MMFFMPQKSNFSSNLTNSNCKNVSRQFSFGLFLEPIQVKKVCSILVRKYLKQTSVKFYIYFVSNSGHISSIDVDTNDAGSLMLFLIIILFHCSIPFNFFPEPE